MVDQTQDPPKWINNQKATINPQNNDYKWFQYTLTAALNREIIGGGDSQRITRIRPFIDQYNWKEKILSQGQKTGKSLKQTTKESLLMFYFTKLQ